MRVMYVDDDRVNILLFEESCRGVEAVEVECASSRAEALALAEAFAPELLVIDLHLAETTGYALLAELRTRPATRAVPAVLCSAEGADDVRAEALAAGFEDCWEKPFDIVNLRAQLARMAAPPASAP